MNNLDKEFRELDSLSNKLCVSLEKRRNFYEKKIEKAKRAEQKELKSIKEKIRRKEFKKLYKDGNESIIKSVEILSESKLEVTSSIETLKDINSVFNKEIKKYQKEKNDFMKKFIAKGRKSSILVDDIDKLVWFLEEIF